MRRWVDHTSEVQLDIEAASEEAVFAEALVGLAELLGGEDTAGASERHAGVEADGPDRAALLVGWMEELLWLAERDGVVPVAAESIELDGNRLRARVRVCARRPRPLVKAITWHGLRFERGDSGFQASVVLDV